MTATNLRQEPGQADRLLACISTFPRLSVGVVGDMMLDQYILGKATRLSQEAPVPVVLVQRETGVPGGAANVVRNILSLGGQAHAFGLAGVDAAGEQLSQLLQQAGAALDGLVEVPDRPTTVKTRVLAGNQQVVRIDREVTAPASAAAVDRLLAHLDIMLRAKRIQAVILEDYAKGLFSRDTMARVVEMCRQAGVPTMLDPHPNSPYNIPGIDLMTPNRSEAFALAGVRYASSGGRPVHEDRPLLETAERLLGLWKVKNLLVTLGGDGMALFRAGHDPVHMPTRAREVFDVSGAGDTVMAAFVMARLGGASLEDAMRISNEAAGIVVGKVGTTAVPLDELKQQIACG